MDKVIKKNIQRFIDEIVIAEKKCVRQSFVHNYECAIKLAESLLSKQEQLTCNDFSELSRYVSDCLPWNDNILLIWNSINKQLKQLQG